MYIDGGLIVANDGEHGCFLGCTKYSDSSIPSDQCALANITLTGATRAGATCSSRDDPTLTAGLHDVVILFYDQLDGSEFMIQWTPIVGDNTRQDMTNDTLIPLQRAECCSSGGTPSPPSPSPPPPSPSPPSPPPAATLSAGAGSVAAAVDDSGGMGAGGVIVIILAVLLCIGGGCWFFMLGKRTNDDVWTCTQCDHVYDPSKDDPEEKDTSFEGLPDTWKCPACLEGGEAPKVTPKADYVKGDKKKDDAATQSPTDTSNP